MQSASVITYGANGVLTAVVATYAIDGVTVTGVNEVTNVYGANGKVAQMTSIQKGPAGEQLSKTVVNSTYDSNNNVSSSEILSYGNSATVSGKTYTRMTFVTLVSGKNDQ